MSDRDLKMLEVAFIQYAQYWRRPGDKKVKSYIDKFFDRKRTGTKITARVEGNHGTYTVSFEAITRQDIVAACSCYIGKGGTCHHCAALAATFRKAPDSFATVTPVKLEDVREIRDLRAYLDSVTLTELTRKLKDKGITQKAFAESMGMNPRHITAVKSAERRNRYYNELGALKLACLWALERFG